MAEIHDLGMVQDMKSISFFVPGPPVPKARPRLGKRFVYTPAATSAYEQRIAAAAAKAMGRSKPTDRAVNVVAGFVLPPLKRDCPEFATARGDIDNYAKAVLDGLNGVVYADDKQVVFLGASKFWPCDDYPQVGTSVTVSVYDDAAR